ncbi:MAG: hypothetical protein HY064_01815 [Bacteroidetes bacterium]|nr:hypothetical protein [Bacteroidota bacterium]
MNTQPQNFPPQNPAPKPQTRSGAITGILFIVALIITAVLMFGDYWPVTWLEDLQQSWFGGYYVKLTFLLSTFLIWLPMFGIQKLVQLLMKK